ncbi:MAG: head GIN domain-containing protein [Bacteroidota bacterium]
MSILGPRFLILSGILLAGMVLDGCSSGVTAPDDRIVGSGRIVSEQRPVSPFTGIQVVGIAKVTITQDTIETLRVEADDNILARVVTSFNGGMLIVNLQEGSYGNITVNIFVSMNTVERLECTGAADFLTAGPIHVDGVVCRITGTGHISLTGSTTAQTIEITGAGEVHNFAFTSSHSSVLISGTGNVEVHAADELNAVIAGTGNIVYSGNPPVVHQTISGVGNINPKP